MEERLVVGQDKLYAECQQEPTEDDIWNSPLFENSRNDFISKFLT